MSLSIERTPWTTMLAAACAIGITPDAFWRLSLNEWRAIAAPRAALAPLHRSEFETLARRFPD